MAYYTWKSYKLRTDPYELFKKISAQKYCFFLDSSLTSNTEGRYSILGLDPFFILQTRQTDSLKQLKALLNRYKIYDPKISLPFRGGAVGFLSYDFGFLLEKKLKKRICDDMEIPDCLFGFYNTALIIDNLKKLLFIFTIGFPETKYNLQKSLCRENLNKVIKLLSKEQNGTSDKPNNDTGTVFEGLRSNFDKEDYLLAVLKAKQYIKEGDIYQVNLSQRFTGKTLLSALEIYGRLRKLSPSFFSAYFNAEDFQILSSSPERFLKLEADNVITQPMKGTRPRGKNMIEDLYFKRELLDSCKDKAELTMIVDLERNDLGKVCKYNSIKVKKIRELEEYSTVFQTTATIRGRLHKDKDRIDLLRASFPGGSITGCPKLRAMEIIEELEPNRRYIYTGSLIYLSFCGNMDSSILIRTILKKGSNIYFGAGGGIVTDSLPELEYQESLIKAQAMIRAQVGLASASKRLIPLLK